MAAPDDQAPPLRPFAGAARIPEALRAAARWAPWRAVWSAKRGKWDKVPARADNPAVGLSTARPEAWFTFDAALAALRRAPGLAGIGYVMTGAHGVVCIDLDDCVDDAGEPVAWAREVIDALASYTERSPGGRGFRVAVLGQVPGDWTNHERGIEVYGGHAPRFLTITGDWLPGTPREVLAAPEGVLEALASQWARETPRRAEVIDLQIPDLVDDLVLPAVDQLALPPAVSRFLATGETTGDRSGALHAAGIALYAAGLDDGEVLSVLAGNDHAMAVALDHRRQDPQRALLYLWREHCVKARGRGLAARVTADDFEAVVPAADAAPALPPFKRSKTGQIEATLGNVLMALRRPDVCRVQIAHDRFLDELVIAPAGQANAWRPLRDEDLTRLREGLTRGGFREIGRELMRDAVVLVAAENEMDAAQAWAATLPEHDGVPRVETFMHRYLGAEDTPYTRAVSLYLWTALAGRVMDPGCQADMALVWVGPQGLRKTSAAKALVPSPSQFLEVDLSKRDDNLARALRGKLVGELGELRGLAGRDAEEIKAWLSRTHEEWVPKFKEFATKFPRRLVFIGTTNKEEFLVDPTGNRRWLPARVGLHGRCDTDAIKRDRDQLWAEALALWRVLGVDWREAEALAEAEHANFMATDSWGESVARWMDEPGLDGEKPRTRKFLRIGEVLHGAIGLNPRDVKRRDEMRMGDLLRTMGMERTKVRDGDRPVWAYVFPPSQVGTQVGTR